MADCKRADIPDELIQRRGQFKCKGTYYQEGFEPYYGCNTPLEYRVEYEPTDGDIIAKGPPSQGANFSPAYEAMRTALSPYVILKNVVYEDEFMSWMSDPITIPNAPVNQARLNDRLSMADCACCGKFGYFSPLSQDPQRQTFMPTQPPPVRCSVISTVDDWQFTGLSVNVSWYGVTLQFVLNLYKVYCCVLNDADEIIDYNYSYNMITTIIKDGQTYLGTESFSSRYNGFSDCVFCYPQLTGIEPGVVYPAWYSTVIFSPLAGDIWVPLKVKEF